MDVGVKAEQSVSEIALCSHFSFGENSNLRFLVKQAFFFPAQQYRSRGIQSLLKSVVCFSFKDVIIFGKSNG